MCSVGIEVINDADDWVNSMNLSYLKRNRIISAYKVFYINRNNNIDLSLRCEFYCPHNIKMYCGLWIYNNFSELMVCGSSVTSVHTHDKCSHSLSILLEKMNIKLNKSIDNGNYYVIKETLLAISKKVTDTDKLYFDSLNIIK